jgi:hypothetical protein
MPCTFVDLDLFLFPIINPLKSHGSVSTTCFNTPKLCILPTECVCVFYMILTVNSDFFP